MCAGPIGDAMVPMAPVPRRSLMLPGGPTGRFPRWSPPPERLCLPYSSRSGLEAALPLRLLRSKRPEPLYIMRLAGKARPVLLFARPV